MLKQELIEMLQCVKCRGSLTYQVDEQDNSRGKLICHTCQLAFRVENDIPILLLDEAIPLEPSQSQTSE